MRTLAVLAAAILASSPALAASADNYPSKPIQLIVPFGAGSPTDIVGRQAAKALSSSLGQPVVVENKPGAGGVLGSAEVARAKPDGYTLLITTNSTAAADTALFKSLPYDPAADFSPITNLNLSPMLLLVNTKVAANSLKALIDYGQKNPSKLKIGVSGSSTRVAAAKLLKLGGFKAITVPYPSIPQSLTATVSGEVSMSFADMGSSLPQIKAKTVVPIGVTSVKSSPLVPQVPTLDQVGLKGFDVVGWQGLAAPAGTNAKIIDKIFKAIKKGYDTQKVRQRFSSLGMQVDISKSPQAYAKFIAAEQTRWPEMVKEAGITPK